jgi:four helix bundle suffix protein
VNRHWGSRDEKGCGPFNPRSAAIQARWVPEPEKFSDRSIGSRRSIYAELSANAALVLIGVAISLLGRQIASLAKTFEQQGGFTERMYRIRQKRRNQTDTT